MRIRKHDVYFSISILSGIMFALSASAWTYLMNLVISPPFWILSFIFWRLGKKTDYNLQRYRIISWIWIVGIIISLAVLVWYLIYD